MAGIFKAYDIRGIYGKTIDASIAHRIGRAVATFLNCRTVVIGRDMRPHSEPLARALAEGLNRQGAGVIDIGLVSTPLLYYGVGSLKADAGVMITASHNPGQWNGMKLTRSDAVPISGATGIQDIERIVATGSFAPPAAAPGCTTAADVSTGYKDHVARLADLKRPIHIAADMANAMGIVEARALEGLIDIDPLFGELDGSFPNHEANPLKEETLSALRRKVSAGRYDFGVAFDGDADRVGFVDEKGGIIPMDMITAVIAENMLQKEKGVVLYDLRSSRAVPEIISENGGTPRMCRVGHAFIKQQMRDENALYAGELSGHYYFRDNFYTESAAMAVLCIANIVSASDRPLSEHIRPMRRYVASGEINSEVNDTAEVLRRIRRTHADGRIVELDGISVAYDDWWFNVRPSNTEPLIRLNLEARSRPLMEEKRDLLLKEMRA